MAYLTVKKARQMLNNYLVSVGEKPIGHGISNLVFAATLKSVLNNGAKSFQCRSNKSAKLYLRRTAKRLCSDVVKADKTKTEVITRAVKDDFYKSWKWRKVRMEVLQKYGRQCMCCGATPDDRAMHGGLVRIVVDHIKPLGKYWHLRIEKTNLQVLCDECNQGKGDWDETDYRPDVIEQLRYVI